jgi:sialate O-acetylesterase
LHVPIGLIVSAVGGVPVESYMSRAALEATSVGKAVLERNTVALAAAKPEALAKFESDTKAWNAANPTRELKEEHKSTRPRKVYGPSSGAVPNRLYNGMLHGLVPYSLRGVIWFQADGNMGHPLEYSELFQALIKNWRGDWKEELPFYFVEMNNMRDDVQKVPVQFNPLSIIREQQHGGLQLPATGIVGSIDLGLKEAHFPNKKPVGERLAGLALRDCYHRSGLVNSPLYRSFSVEGNKVRLKFSDADGLRLRSGGGELKGFAIRADKGEWVWATGRIDGQDIVVWDDHISSPAAVRYAWAFNPVISVENGAGLPLLPFRTDTGSEQ